MREEVDEEAADAGPFFTSVRVGVSGGEERGRELVGSGVFAGAELGREGRSHGLLCRAPGRGARGIGEPRAVLGVPVGRARGSRGHRGGSAARRLSGRSDALRDASAVQELLQVVRRSRPRPRRRAPALAASRGRPRCLDRLGVHGPRRRRREKAVARLGRRTLPRSSRHRRRPRQTQRAPHPPAAPQTRPAEERCCCFWRTTALLLGGLLAERRREECDDDCCSSSRRRAAE